MRSFHSTRTVLVPVFGGDVSEETVALASALLTRAGSRLVLLHVIPPASEDAAGSIPRTCAEREPRWRRLASAAAPNRTFVEAVVGDPATEVLDQAERFQSADIVLGPPTSAGTADAWMDRAIARVLRDAPCEVYVANRRARPPRSTRLAHPKAQRAFHQRRSHAAKPKVPLTSRAGR